MARTRVGRLVETVECSECANRYDSQANAFCPRCGSTKTGTPMPGALALSQRHDPRRRRVQMAGVLLLVMGTLFLILTGSFLAMLARGDPLSDDMYAAAAPVWGSREGGMATLYLLDNGTAAGDVTLVLRAMTGNATTNVTPESPGEYRFALPGMFSNLTVQRGNETWIRHLYAPEGTALNFTLDLARDPHGPKWESIDMRGVAMVSVGVFAFLALMVVLGGVAAMRLRWYPLALTGAIVPTAVSLFVALMGLVLVWFLYVILFAWALLLIARGRPYFRRKAK